MEVMLMDYERFAVIGSDEGVWGTASDKEDACMMARKFLIDFPNEKFSVVEVLFTIKAKVVLDQMDG